MSTFFPELAFAQWAGGFETRVGNLTTKLVSVILPALSTLSLLWAVFMALTGDGESKGRIIAIIVVSIVGVMAPMLMKWFQSAAGG